MFMPIYASSRQQRKHTYRPARTAFELDWRHNQERPFFRQFAQIRQILKVVEPRSQRQMMHSKILRSSAIHTNCVTSDAADLAFYQPLDGLYGKSRKMHAPLRVLIAVTLHIRPA